MPPRDRQARGHSENAFAPLPRHARGDRTAAPRSCHRGLPWPGRNHSPLSAARCFQWPPTSGKDTPSEAKVSLVLPAMPHGSARGEPHPVHQASSVHRRPSSDLFGRIHSLSAVSQRRGREPGSRRTTGDGWRMTVVVPAARDRPKSTTDRNRGGKPLNVRSPKTRPDRRLSRARCRSAARGLDFRQRPRPATALITFIALGGAFNNLFELP